jgi:hypothetical protein
VIDLQETVIIIVICLQGASLCSEARLTANSKFTQQCKLLMTRKDVTQ